MLFVDKHDKGGEGVEYTACWEKLSVVEQQLQTAGEGLDESQLQISHLQEEKASMELQVEELKAEIASTFYRACTPMQRSDYGLLIAELGKRFTPVRLPAIETQVFHDRRQGPRETVDEFAQELRKLYANAYAPVTRGTREAEEVGQRVLASQFVTGFLPELQSTVVGLEGNMDKLVMKARFEEAKRKELTAVRTVSSLPRKINHSSPATTTNSADRSSTQVRKTNPADATAPKMNGSIRKCYNCGLGGHRARACPYPKLSRRDGEATGRPV